MSAALSVRVRNPAILNPSGKRCRIPGNGCSTRGKSPGRYNYMATPAPFVPTAGYPGHGKSCTMPSLGQLRSIDSIALRMSSWRAWYCQTAEFSVQQLVIYSSHCSKIVKHGVGGVSELLRFLEVLPITQHQYFQ